MPLIRFFKFNLMLNKQNYDNMSEMKKKKTWIIILQKKKQKKHYSSSYINWNCEKI